MKTQNQFTFITLILVFLLLAGCSNANGSSGAPKAAEDYYQALVEKDENTMINLSCAAWEQDTKTMFTSFAAVDLDLEDLACQQDSLDGDKATVSCQGSLIANYGAEVLEIDIAERPFAVVKEGGEWRMCGYQGD
jgi:outer membrane murein-binding lipoprotein Lpp